MRFPEARRHFFHAPRCASSEWKNRGPGARGISLQKDGKNFTNVIDKMSEGVVMV